MTEKTPRVLAASVLLLLAAGAFATQAQETTQSPAEKLTRLQGRARLSRSQGVVGAAVFVQRDQDPGHFFITSSGANGEFHIDRLPDGEYTVTLDREGYRTEIKTGIKLKFPFRAVVEVTMEAGVSAITTDQPQRTVAGPKIDLRGVVTDVSGAPLSEIQLRAVRDDGSADPRSLRTQQDGVFEFSELPAGAWRVEISGIGYLTLRQALFLTIDSKLEAQLVPQPADYLPGPLDLMPPEVPVLPNGFAR